MPLTPDQVLISIAVGGIATIIGYLFGVLARGVHEEDKPWVSKPTHGGWWWHYGELCDGRYPPEVRLMCVYLPPSGEGLAYCPRIGKEFVITPTDTGRWMESMQKPAAPEL